MVAGVWKPMCGSDSLLMERAWRSARAGQTVAEKVPVMGGLYHFDAVIATPPLRLQPLFWERDWQYNPEVYRGIWFEGAEWQPLGANLHDDRRLAEEAEKKHLDTFKGQPKPSGTTAFVDKSAKRLVLASLKHGATELIWHSPIDILRRSTGVKSRIVRGLGVAGAGVSLHRGYKDQALASDSPPPVDHLIFVVHGIGQLATSVDIVAQTDRLRDLVGEAMLNDYPGAERRCLLLPIQWRRSLELNRGLVEAVTPLEVPSLRRTVCDVICDILYYLNPYYRDQIIGSVVASANSAYKLFLETQPNFLRQGGRVSFFAHSLGLLRRLSWQCGL